MQPAWLALWEIELRCSPRQWTVLLHCMHGSSIAIGKAGCYKGHEHKPGATAAAHSNATLHTHFSQNMLLNAWHFSVLLLHTLPVFG